jgi:hypothetical protein
MLPAGVLKIFLSPFAGISGLAIFTFEMTNVFINHPDFSSFIALIKYSIKWLLFLLIIFSFPSVFSGKIKNFLPLRLAILLTLASVILADYYYFWGIYENISRMFTILIPLMIFLCAEENRAGKLFFAVVSAIAVFVFIRILVLTPAFPYDNYSPYTGSSHRLHAPLPVLRY